MTSILSTLRETPQRSPSEFLDWNAACWIHYFDDSRVNDPAKAFSTRTFDAAFAARKQRDRCGVCYSLQGFGETWSMKEFLVFRNMGVDVHLVPASQQHEVPPAEIERRKEEYLLCRLDPFPLKPHWLVETCSGFQMVFRVRPLRQEADVHEALAVNRRLAGVLGGDENAVTLMQIFRVPGTIQFANPQSIFLCQILKDYAGVISPYDSPEIARVLEHGIPFLPRHPERGPTSSAVLPAVPPSRHDEP